MKPTFRAFVSMSILSAALALGGSASADEATDAQGFVQKEHGQISQLLKQPPSAGRDGQINGALDGFVDYDELARRAFGQPCPATISGCTNHWGELTDAQKAEVRGLLRQLVAKNYRKNLIKTLDYDVEYKGARAVTGGDNKIRTEAKSKLKPRDPPVQVDYIVRNTNGAFKVVDIVTEGSSLTKNYYDQFHRMLTTAGQGYPHVVKKLNDKIAKPD